MERKYFEINEASARQAHEMMSFDEYRTGSKTAEYRAYVDEVYALADTAIERRPRETARIERLAVRYARLMADNLNAASRIGCYCPSVMICGPANFPVRKKERQLNMMARNHEDFQRIQKIKEKINSILNGSEIIKSGDPDAIERLQEKIEDLQQLQDTMKAVNAYYRENGSLDGCPYLSQESLDKLKTTMEQSWHPGESPFPSWQLTNNRQNLRSTQERLDKLLAIKKAGTSEEVREYFRVVENTENMRLQLFFEEKPVPEVRNILKKNGFRRAPSQRMAAPTYPKCKI